MSLPIALISGGSDGLGKALASHLRDTHTVVILSRDEEKTASTAAELGVSYVTANVRSAQAIEQAVAKVIAQYGRIDVLINNAGCWIGGPLDTHTYEEIETVINVNYTGMVFLTRAVMPYMKQQGSGYIINIVSTAGLTGKTERTIYNSSKFAAAGFTKSLQPELAPHGIRVTGLYPGPIDTKLFAKGGYERDMTGYALNSSDVADMVHYLLGTPETFLCPEVVLVHRDYKG